MKILKRKSTLKEAKIERFGYLNDKYKYKDMLILDKYKYISTYYQITYIWEHKILGITYQKEEKVPILFENEFDATDFIECGCNAEVEISQNMYDDKKLYDFYAYKIDDPDKKYKILSSPLKGYESLFVAFGYEQEKSGIYLCSGKISDFFEKIKQHENKQKEKERKDKEYIDSLYEVKTYKIEKIEK